MGLPQQHPDQESSQQSTTQAQPQSAAPRDPSQLPPEALDLVTKLFDFARQGKTPELRQYITAGIPLNLTNHKGDTLLMLASYYGQVETLQMLLEKGADVNVLNDRGQSPIAGAVFKGYDEVVRVLVGGGADPRAGQPNAVESAMMFKREDCMRMFDIGEAEREEIAQRLPPSVR
ncbi:hypothetical protein LTR08_007340 [Meristemomyces frigidus]|nr:hypothetical protein LTR08_007340 [Meristemomyces frigidus]